MILRWFSSTSRRSLEITYQLRPGCRCTLDRLARVAFSVLCADYMFFVDWLSSSRTSIWDSILQFNSQFDKIDLFDAIYVP